MRLGLLSDAHGNHIALRHAATWLAPQVDGVIFAGDAFSDHRFSNEVVGTLRDLDATYVQGNHERSLLSPAGIRARESAHVDAALLAWVAARPARAEMVADSVRILVVHASLWPPYDQYLTPSAASLEPAADLEADVLVVGHAHQPFAVHAGSTLVVNPGSVGRADAPGLGDLQTFAILDTGGSDDGSPSATHYAFAGPDGPISRLHAG